MPQSAESEPTIPRLPEVEDATMADISGFHGLSQRQLWENAVDAHVGSLPAWVVSEARRVAEQGISSGDAFICGVGYAITALRAQLARDADKEGVTALFAPYQLDPPLPDDAHDTGNEAAA